MAGHQGELRRGSEQHKSDDYDQDCYPNKGDRKPVTATKTLWDSISPGHGPLSGNVLGSGERVYTVRYEPAITLGDLQAQPAGSGRLALQPSQQSALPLRRRRQGKALGLGGPPISLLP